MKRLLILLFALSATALGCTTSTPSALPRSAPWRSTPIPRIAVQTIYVEQWSKAENRDTCALVTFRTLGDAGKGAQARAANFAGGWAVAYDFSHLRSAFGIAGAGVKADDPSYDKWPYAYEWGDGSKVEYGPEGGQGPNQLAYLRIAGQDCLYNVWSRRGREHLEELLREIRMVE
ncbi:MAG TPA: hypothetical protein VGQ36_13295 [Thermoanaerobaculia bacterium]|jgi:hypothetical protein|nr:hypothetical protein [Thermoanaerobaculia bacterium]